MAKNLEYTLRLKDLFSKTMQGASNQVKGLDGKMNGLKSSLGGLKGAIAGAFSIGAVVSFGKAVIDSLKNYEYFHASLKTLLKGNENATKALESQLVNLAKTTPFELTEVQDATKQLMAYGFKAGEVVQTMRTLGDVSAGIGAPLGDIAYLYGTLKTSGRVTLMDLRQFAGRGIPIYETLAKRLKTTTDAINGLASNGKIAFKDIEGAFKDMTSEGGQFFKLMEDQSKTVGGKLSNLGDAWDQLFVNIGKSQSGILNNTITWVSNIFDIYNQKLSAGNFLDEALTKVNQLNKYSSLTRFYGNLAGFKNIKALSGNYAEMQDEAAYGQRLISSATNMKQALYNMRILEMNMQKNKEARDKGELSNQDYITKLAIQNETLNGLKGVVDVLKQKENKGIGSTGIGGIDSGKATKSLGTGTEVTGQRPQAINIAIDKLVNELNIQTTNLTEGTTKMKELVSKALLEAVNDINLMAMA